MTRGTKRVWPAAAGVQSKPNRGSSATGCGGGNFRIHCKRRAGRASGDEPLRAAFHRHVGHAAPCGGGKRGRQHQRGGCHVLCGKTI